MVASASGLNRGLRATCRYDEVACRAYQWDSGPSVVRFDAVDFKPNHVSSARSLLCAVAPSGLRPSRALSRRLRPSIQPFRIAGASYGAHGATRSKHAPQDLKSAVEGGD